MEKSSLYKRLPAGLRLIGDSGYAGQFDKVITTMDADSPETKELSVRLKSMQEMRFKGSRISKSSKSRFGMERILMIK